ncbi:hypothetical protein D3C80_2168250 [compost metagenome]
MNSRNRYQIEYLKVLIAACGRLPRYNTTAHCRNLPPSTRAQIRYSIPLIWITNGIRLTASSTRVYSRMWILV